VAWSVRQFDFQQRHVMKTSRPSQISILAAAISMTLIATPVFMLTTAVAQTVSKADQVRGMNGQVLELQAEARRAQGSANTAMPKIKAKQLLAARAQALGELIAADPTQAERLAFPASVLAQLVDSFPEASAYLEQRGAWQGSLEFMVEDGVSLQTSRSVYKLRSADELIDVHFSGKEPPGLKSGQALRVRGIRSGKKVVASDVEFMNAPADGSTTTTSTNVALANAAVCSTTGPQNVVSILVNFPSYSLPSAATADFVRGVLLGNSQTTVQSAPDWSVDSFWRESSDGKTYVNSANTTVVGPVMLASNFNTDSTGAASCDVYGIRDAAIKAVDGQVDFRQYSRVQIIMPPNGSCGWAGTAYIGCVGLSSPGDGAFTASVAWQRADTMTTRAKAVQLSTHEMGHNLGLGHASSRDYGSEALGALSAAGTLNEYGDIHSTMGSWNFGYYVAPQASNTLGWLTSGSNYQTVESSGTYTIQNYEARPAGLKALKIRRGTGNDAWLWLESRQNSGIFSSQLDSSLFGGALIHYQDATTSYKSHLIDFTPATASFADGALPAGTTWIDPYSNVSVTVNSVTATAMTVTVNYGGVTCNVAAPTIVTSPTSVATAYGSSTQFNVSVKNNSSAGCAAETVNLSSVVPSGWSSKFGNGSLTISPGQQAQTVLTVGVPAPYTLGTYPVTSAAKSGSTGKGSSDTENVTVIEPTKDLSLSISGSGSVALSSPAKKCTTSCITSYSGGSTIVTMTAAAASKFVFGGWTGACSGAAATCTVTMDASRSVTATFKRSTGRK
jgi:M6 family metalloprotease-like protein